MMGGERDAEPGLSRAGSSVTRVLRTSAWAMGDQALISATNFATMVLLARELSRSAFGAFVLVYSGLLFANSVQAALITQPHQVLGPGRSRRAYDGYTTSAGAQQIVLAAAMAGAALCAAAGAWAAGWSAAGLFAMLACALVAWQCQEFVRRVFYTEGRAGAVAVNDLISYGGQFAGVAILWRVEELSATTALGAVTICFALGAAVGAWQLRHRFVRSVKLLDGTRENWQFGRWLLGSTLAMWTSSQLYPVLTAGFVSVAATGALRAMQTVMGPTHVLLKALDTAFTPTASRAYGEGGAEAVTSLVGAMYRATAALMIGYCVLVAVFARPILDVLYGGRYNSYSWLLPMLAVSYALVYLYTPVWVALRGMQVSSPMFHAYLASTVVVLTLGIAAVALFGLAGAGAGLIAHGVILNVALWRSFRSAVAAPASSTKSEPAHGQVAVEVFNG
jgi:O-antigen/teichoic acid export membrane protein